MINKNNFKVPQEKALRSTHWILNQFKKSSKILKQFSPLLTYLKQKLQPLQIVTKFCQKKWQQTKDFFQNSYQRALTLLKKREEKLKRVSPQQVLDYLASHWLKKFPLYIQALLKKCLSYLLIREIIKAGVKIFLFLAQAFLTFAKKTLEVLSKVSSILIKACHQLWKTIRLFCSIGCNGLNISCKTLQKGAFYSLYYSLLFLTIVFILLVWGLRLVRDNTSSFISILSLKKINTSPVNTKK